MTFPPLADAGIMLGAHATDWRDAVRLAGRALRLSGSTRAEYSDRMIAVIEEFGAYVVIAPGLALAHARPGPDVRREGLAVVTLAEPVAFGHPHNDPVRVVARQRLQRRHHGRASRAGHVRRRGAPTARRGRVIGIFRAREQLVPIAERGADPRTARARLIG